MQSSTLAISASDGTSLHTYRWLPDGPPRGIVQIAHGMAEHAARYERFAEALTGAGYAVYANDHRGHGHTGSPQDRGHFGDHDGWSTVVDDLGTVSLFAQAEHPGVPLVLFGHSMGAMLSRSYAAVHGSRLAGLILSANSGGQGPLVAAGIAASAIQSRLMGKRHPSGLMDTMSFGKFNSAFRPNRTKSDWLSRDDAEVDKYIADPLCGYVMSSTFYGDLARGLQSILKNGAYAAVPKDLPILLMSGEKDPVGDGGKGPREVEAGYRKAGVTDLTSTIYPDARHELLHETNRDEVTADVLSWLDERIPARD